MKRILVPTDFSKNAKVALSYAVNIANHFDAEIVVLNTYQLRTKAGVFLSMEDILIKDAEVEMDKLKKEFKPRLFQQTIFTTKVMRGETTDAIAAIANNHKVDLIVMGTKGASGLKEIFLGSNTMGVIKKTSVPVLTIPEDATYQPLKRIVFAIDSLNVKGTSLAPLAALAKAYKATVDIFHIENAPVTIGIDPAVDVFLADIPHQFYQFHDLHDITGSIDGFVEEIRGDMLCLIRRQRSILDNLFHTSVTQKEVYHSKTPLLILQE